MLKLLQHFLIHYTQKNEKYTLKRSESALDSLAFCRASDPVVNPKFKGLTLTSAGLEDLQLQVIKLG